VINIGEGHVDLSLRESRLVNTNDHPVKDREITAVSDVKIGQILRGFIKSKTDVGFFVRWVKCMYQIGGLSLLLLLCRLGRKVTGRVKIGNLTDKYVEDFKSLYQVGELVTAKVIGYSTIIL